MVNLRCMLLVWAFLFTLSNKRYGVRGDTSLPFTLGVRDSLMIAHSFHNHPAFGPAGGLHGATYTVDVEWLAEELAADTNWVLDIGMALSMVSEVLSRYQFKNLDDVFPDGTLTTTEFMCRQIYADLCEKMGQTCPDYRGELCVKLWESHKAWASYRGKVG